MPASNRRPQPSSYFEAVTLFVGMGLVVLAVGTVYAGAHLGHKIAGLPPAPANPFETFFGVITGEVSWPRASTVSAALIVTVAAAVAALVGWQILRWRGGRSRVDQRASVLGRGSEIAPLTGKAVAAKSQRLGVDPAAQPGLPLGRTVAGNQPLLSSWEDMLITIAGPRTGKTTSMVIPSIMAAPGAVLVTSNKRDVVDATRGPRATHGEVWVFDPQEVVGEPVSWWWNPLTYVTDETKAARMAQHFAAGSREAGSRADAYFDNAGKDLLAGLLLAAALDHQPITQVYTWLTRPTDDSPVGILASSYPLLADQLAGAYGAPEKQRGGVFGTAQQMASCLTNSTATRWVTPPTSAMVPEFDPHQFVTGTGTLYSLSREGAGNAGPLVTALTVAVVEAAEKLATASPGGRLPVPMVGVLDEAANVCRWSDLPALYSHYGSKGIVISTILQSWSQGVDVWAESGMQRLWSSANVRIYAGGVAEHKFLSQFSELIGTYDKPTRSVSVSSRAGRQTSHQLGRERIFEVDELAALPAGRAVITASGARPVLVRLEPWYEQPYAPTVQASIAQHDPGAVN